MAAVLPADGREIIRQNEIRPYLAHERGAGSPCLKCGPKCEGLDLHFWRKICKICHCKYEDHDVKNEEEIHHNIVQNIFRKDRGLPESVSKLTGDLKQEPDIGEDVKANFIQVPQVSSTAAMAKYLSSIPKGKAAHHDEAGAQYRAKQLANQLPAHDFDEAFCDDLTDAEKEKLQEFSDLRAEEAAGQGEIVEKTAKIATDWLCDHCNESLYNGDVAIFADRVGKEKCWHPQCFVCDTCKEVLVDLIYFFKDGGIFCGRHYGELTRVRCAACDELIFSKEYTQAEDKSWHLKHFCCYNCDAELGGQKYVAREEKPYCLKCYEGLFAKVCEACKDKIPADGKRISYKDAHWHAVEACFSCVTCKRNMLGEQFIYKDNQVFCSPQCAKKR